VTTWITQVEAARILGLASVSGIPKLVGRGMLHPRETARRYPSLDKREVQALARRRARHKAEVVERRRQREPQTDSRPDTDHDWLSPSEVAALVGITTPGVMKRIHSGRLPATHNARRWWIRADHLELVERARRTQLTRHVA
jgi:helix-turn-helix protein